ncbi:uncharacterized protein [Atheta coriaria]|uniref:uncharacterized protein n=1 Tax=Dalotia coriaria TaxID=877792 RepID=UPI0031F350AD
MAARKSRLYLDSFIPVNQTHDDIVKKIFRSGKFACTITANLQLVGIISLCANLAIVVVSDYCHFHPCKRKLNIGTAIATICNATALYLIFCCGYAVNNPSLWVRLNIISNLTLSIITIVAQSMSMKECLTLTKIHKSPGPMALVGGTCLLLSCFSLFLLYRYKELDIEINDIIRERKESEDRNNAGTSTQRSSVVRSEDDRKRSGSDNPHMHHIKANIYVKQEDDTRKSSVHSLDEYRGVSNGPKRKVSVYSRPDMHGHVHKHCSHRILTHNCRRKISSDVNARSAKHDSEYPQCSKSRRKNSLYTKHI